MWRVAVFCALVLSCSVPAPEPEIVPTFQEQLVDHSLTIVFRSPITFSVSIVGTGLSVEVEQPEERMWAGSGTYVLLEGEPFILTAYHMYPALMRTGGKYAVCHLEAYTFEEECVFAMVGEDAIFIKEMDIMFVPLNRPLKSATPAPIREDFVVPLYGDQIWVAGCPASRPNMVFSGNIVGYGDGTEDNPEHYVYTDAPLTFGNSGAGIYTPEGTLIGVFTSVAAVSLPTGFQVPAEGLHIFSLLPTNYLRRF